MSRTRSVTIYLRLLPLLVCTVLLTACEEPIELNIDVPRPRLVINSNFFPDETVKLRISATRLAGSTLPPTEITDAIVDLYEGDTFAERLIYHYDLTGKGGRFETVNFRPRAGNNYTLHVTAEGYEPVTAVSSIPAPVQITSLDVKRLTTTEDQGQRIYDYTLIVDYDDPPAEENFYDLRIYQRVIPFIVSPAGDTLQMVDQLKSVGTPEENIRAERTATFLLRDHPGLGGLTLRLRSSVAVESELAGSLVAELRTVSPEYYYHQIGLAREAGRTENGLSEPIVIFSTIDSGLGVFAGYSPFQAQVPLGAGY